MSGSDHGPWLMPLPLTEDWTAAIPRTAALPCLTEPAEMPLAQESGFEPLVPVDHPRVTVVPCYRQAGWSEATSEVLVRSGVLERLCAAVEHIPDPWGLAVLDGWRPLALQDALFRAAYADPALPSGFVAEPSSSPTTPPPHLTGGAIDCTLTWEGTPLALGTDFDDFTPRARTDALECEPGPARDLRRWLYWVMRAEGFVVLDVEWWHFEFGTRRWAAVTGAAPRYGPAVGS